MTDHGSDNHERLKLALSTTSPNTVWECYFVDCVESGRVEIGDRAAEAIIADVAQRAKEDVKDNELEFVAIVDHRDNLLDRALAAVSEGALGIAVVLYATWIEHYINGLLLITLSRQGVSSQSSKTLLRELRLKSKVTALWELANLPALAPTYLKLIDGITVARNEFVHYKWPVASVQDKEKQRRDLDELNSLVQMLHEIEDRTLWYGRREEIMAVFRRQRPTTT
jgi:hypothetical protein